MSDEGIALAYDDVTFRYPGSHGDVLSGVSMAVPAGAFVLLVGGTGSGKSTLLSLAKPQIAPAGDRAGQVRVFGRPVDDLDGAEACEVGYVFQDPDNQIVCDSVWHEMAFGLENLGTPQGEMRRRVAEASYFFGMGPWFHSDTDALSGGRKQLLALASTLVMQPRVLLLDEPTAQLDPIAARNFLHALFRVNRELGCTVVVATHEPELMADYATCAFELVDGAVRPVEDLGRFKCEAALAERGALCDANAPAAVSARGAWFRYGRDDDWVLRGLDLEVRQGEVHALVGGNGCGKSTLLALIAGTRRAQRGEVRSAISAKAMLPQDPKALFAEERVDEELMEWAHIGGYGADEVQAMMGELGLADRAGLHPYDLSGGQRQMLALGKLLLVHPRLLLLDEPTRGLDRAAREHVAGMIEAARRDGVTVIVSTHDLAFVRRVADRVSLMFDGELACTEPVGEFFRNNLFYRP
ncbi:Putative HMP/thiamine import ATP-binding protein YkoD [Collinsella intestinalis]|uniref:HMP/thiamine import ATP-binding protein YkoD n=1 Tax=Collinsella intestinalis TaxID=147207 RepID=A0A5K1IKG9_9ACTN|nr:ATP-binding cassette domain-containing protein [Collinsella intestinalis]VWL87979.1 Putative HMP/thiamine import ATP-binding protein YkoD [Collinsella intestinalis]